MLVIRHENIARHRRTRTSKKHTRALTFINLLGTARLHIYGQWRTSHMRSVKADYVFHLLRYSNSFTDNITEGFAIHLLHIDGPFLAKDSYDIINYLSASRPNNVRGLSIDIKDLFYSLPQARILASVQNSIDRFGAVRFQNTSGTSSGGFLELLSVYLRSTFIRWNELPFLQKNGICIGPCIAPVLSDLYLAEIDRDLSSSLTDLKVTKVLRYVDDYLIFLDCDSATLESLVANTLNHARAGFLPLVITHELPSEDSLRFLDIRLLFQDDQILWAYEPRANKPLLAYDSAHSKLVKRGIAKLGLMSWVKNVLPAAYGR